MHFITAEGIASEVDVDEMITTLSGLVEREPDDAAKEGLRAAVKALRGLKGKVQDCPMCGGSGNKDGNPCEACDGTGEMKKKMKAAEAPPEPTPQPRAAACGCTDTVKCGCHGQGARIMEKATRAELIASLVTDRYSGFKDGDEAILEAAADTRLEEFRTAADARKAADASFGRLETDHRNTTARLKVAEEKLKAAEAPMTEDEFLARAPESFKRTLEARKGEEDALRASIISQLKDLGANTEDELKAKSTPDLQTLAKYAGVQVQDFSGRGVPVSREAEQRNDNYAPPDPYAAGLKALQGGSKAVN